MQIKRKLMLSLLSFCLLLAGCASTGKQAAQSSHVSISTSSETASMPSSSDSSATPASQTEQAASSGSGAASSKSSGAASSTVSSRASSVSSVQQSVSQQPVAQTVALAIDASKGGGSKYQFSVQWQAGDTAYSILKRGCDKNKVALYAQQSGGVYVKSIAGVAEMGGQTGWLYKITENGKATFPGKSADSKDAASVKPGDTVSWLYTVDMGKSEGAPQG